MTLRTFLLGTDRIVRSHADLWNHGGAAEVAEIAEASGIAPLPWFALFKQEDLRPVEVTRQLSQFSDPVAGEVMVPCTPIETALVNLIRARPMFERLTGEQELATAYWRRAIDTLKKHKLPYVAMDLTGLLDSLHIRELDRFVREALEGQDHGWNVMRRVFLQWVDGVVPAPLAAVDGIADAACARSLRNARALDANIHPPGLTFAR